MARDELSLPFQLPVETSMPRLAGVIRLCRRVDANLQEDQKRHHFFKAIFNFIFVNRNVRATKDRASAYNKV